MTNIAGQVTAALAAVIVMSGCSRAGDGKAAAPESAAETARETWPAMGTFATLTVSIDEQARLSEYAVSAKKIMKDIETSLSIFNADSEISRLNESAGKAAVPVSARTREVLGLSVKYSELSGGTFDVTVGPLVKAWGFAGGKRPEKPLDETAVRETLRMVGYRHIVLSNDTAYLDVPGASVNLGGIGKGYAVDVCYEKLVEMKAVNFIVDLGGNMRCSGTHPGGRPWTIGVRNPFRKDEMLGTVALGSGMAVGTSGNYEQCFMMGNDRYTHIIDPRTGYPVKGMAGVTVVSTNAVETEGMTKPLFILGVEGSRPLLAGRPGCHALFVPDEQPVKIYVTPGFRKLFTPAPAFAESIVEAPVGRN